MPLLSPVPVEPADAVGAVHFIAAGGSGMSGIAAAYAALGVGVGHCRHAAAGAAHQR